jgi:triacylglycerol lipase
MPAETQDPVPATSSTAWWGRPLSECSWQWELAGLLRDPVWRGRGVGAGDGSPVLLVPGFLSADSSLSIMSRWLRRIGLRSHRAGIRLNADCADRAVRRLESRLINIAEGAGRQVHVIGHSRGGLFARALLTRHPEHIAQVITLGSPLTAEFDCSVPVAVAVAGARAAQNLIRPGSRKAGCFTSHCQCGYPADLATDLAPGARFTSIYSFDDGMVRPSACQIAGADCIAVPGSHLGLPVNAEVYKHLARLLPIAQTEG